MALQSWPDFLAGVDEAGDVEMMKLVREKLTKAGWRTLESIVKLEG